MYKFTIKNDFFNDADFSIVFSQKPSSDDPIAKSFDNGLKDDYIPSWDLK